MQSMMYYQFPVRNQQPKGFTVKRVLQYALLLAVGIWVLYQIYHSQNERNEYGGSSHSKLSEEQRSNILGRKGNSGWSNRGGDSESNSEAVNLMGVNEKKEDTGGGDDELDWYPKEKDKVESHLKENENISSTLLHDKDGVKENDEDKVPTKMKSEIPVQHGGLVNTTVLAQSEKTDGVHSFPDENGLPQDVIEKFIRIESTESDTDSTTIQSMLVEGEDDELKEGRVTAYAESSDMVQGNDIDSKVNNKRTKSS